MEHKIDGKRPPLELSAIGIGLRAIALDNFGSFVDGYVTPHGGCALGAVVDGLANYWRRIAVILARGEVGSRFQIVIDPSTLVVEGKQVFVA